MSSLRSRLVALGVVTGLLTAVGVGGAVPAFAQDRATTVGFADAAPVTAEFGSDWHLAVVVAGEDSESSEYGPLTVKPESGTVDIYMDGIAGAYASGLPLQANGVAYFAQPTSRPLLGAGTYTVRAIFNPLAGSRLLSSQTATPASLTITALDATAHVSATMDVSVSEVPVITASLTGSFVEKNGAPAGTWDFTVVDGEGATAFASSVAQDYGSTDDITVPVTGKLARGEKFTLRSVFTPEASLVSGITLTQAPAASFTSASADLGEALVTPVPLAWWMIGVAIAVLLLLAGGVVWLAVLVHRSRLRNGAAAGDKGGEAEAVPPMPLKMEPEERGLGSLVRPRTVETPLPDDAVPAGGAEPLGESSAEAADYVN